VANSNVSQLIQDKVIPSSSGDCMEISWQDCESIYNGFLFDHGDVIFTAPDIYNQPVTPPIDTTAPLYDSTFMSLRNMSRLSWNISIDFTDFGNLTIADKSYNVTSCCSRIIIEAPCKLTFDVSVMMIVIICNVVKTICMFLVVLKAEDYPLVTLGDAIASFLERPDPATKGMCLISKRNVLDKAFNIPQVPRKWKGGSESMAEKEYYAVSARRWGWVNAL
jgi:hypothetical protein